MKNPLIVICGPTASGKTDFALKLAREKNGELVSADSRQIYKYLDIGTGKDLPDRAVFIDQTPLFENIHPAYTVGFHDVNGVPLWLYDVLTPDQQFSAAEYAQVAREVLQDIWSRRKLPIIVGGTGFYINALVDGIETEGIPANEELRNELKDKSLEELQHILHEVNRERLNAMNNSDRNNPRRLVRAIEITLFLQLHPEENGYEKNTSIKTIKHFIGLQMPKEDLYERIDQRVEMRLTNGMLHEIESVLKSGYSWDDPGMNTIGYKQLRAYFEKEESLDEAVQKWKNAEHDYARRQMTWFNKDTRINWINGTEPSS